MERVQRKKMANREKKERSAGDGFTRRLEK
jgi:hypothetical protein